MVQISVSTSTKSLITAPGVAVAGPKKGGFANALATVLPDGLQAVAAIGKQLPGMPITLPEGAAVLLPTITPTGEEDAPLFAADGTPILATDGDAPEIPSDIAAMMTGFTFAPAQPAPQAPPLGGAAVPTTADGIEADLSAVLDPAVALGTGVATTPTRDATAAVTTPDVDPALDTMIPPEGDMPAFGTKDFASMLRPGAGTPVGALAQPAVLTGLQPQPAAPQFAAAMAASLDTSSTGAGDSSDDLLGPIQITGHGTHDVTRTLAVPGVGGGQQAALDMSRDNWPTAMIDRIEALRDAADVNDTRIRVVPDMLGSIDVSVRKDGDTVNVRFSSENAQTRQLLADAAPKLAEAAESRGLKLGQSSVDSGNAGQGQARQDQKNPVFNHVPASASAGAGADVATDDRVA